MVKFNPQRRQCTNGNIVHKCDKTKRRGNNSEISRLSRNSMWCSFASFLVISYCSSGWFRSTIYHTVYASNQQRRPGYRNHRNNLDSSNNYDRSVTTFDPHGHLLQVEYAQYAATQRTKRTLIAMIDDNDDDSAIYIATTMTSTNDDEPQAQAQPQPHQFVHRITADIYLIGIGFIGDIRAIASHVRVEAQQYYYNTNEDITVDQIVTMIVSKLQHQCTYQTGVRPLAATCFVFTTGRTRNNDNNNNDNNHHHRSAILKLYKCSPSGATPEDCYYCTAGYHEDRILETLHTVYHQNSSPPISEPPPEQEDERYDHSFALLRNSTNSTETTTTTTSVCTKGNHQQLDRIERFLSSLYDTFNVIDNKSSSNNHNNDEPEQRIMDLYVFRRNNCSRRRTIQRTTNHSRSTGSSSSTNQPYQQPYDGVVTTCFANICFRNFHESLDRIRQYYK